MLVALGVCGIAIIQKEIYKDMILLIQTNQDLSLSLKPENQRLIAQVITGVGFLGAGAILKTHDRIEGLTTASSIWVVAMAALIFGTSYETNMIFFLFSKNMSDLYHSCSLLFSLVQVIDISFLRKIRG